MWAVFAPVLIALSACTAQFRNHGFVPSEEDLAEIVVGVDTKASVDETIGVPSATGVLNDDGYYYVRSRMRTYGPRASRVVDRQLVVIDFSDAGVVTDIQRYGLEDGQAVLLSRRVTDSPTKGKGILRQLLGNVGNFGLASP
ncbi:MAG: outer membrane protein assembly factor BamE [Paracoccaceae bacterium]